MADEDVVSNAIKLLQEFKETLPVGHPERPGVLRAIEVLIHRPWYLQRYDATWGGWRNQLTFDDRSVTYANEEEATTQVEIYTSGSRRRYRLYNVDTKEIITPKKRAI